MTGPDTPEKIDLVFKEDESRDTPQQEQPRGEVGSSSLYGRVGDNITFHQQGATDEGLWDRLWSWAWRDLGQAFFSLLRVFFPGGK